MQPNAYDDWLYSLVGLPRHTRLLEYLHSIEFLWTITNDRNRALDGERLREVFIDTVLPQGSQFLPNSRCSILEMLLGVAHHIEFQLAQSPWEMGVPGCMEIMFRNLDIFFMTDSRYDEREVDDKLRIFINRAYSYDGKGGLFPLKNGGVDQRNVEIWNQMMSWLVGKYDL